MRNKTSSGTIPYSEFPNEWKQSLRLDYIEKTSMVSNVLLSDSIGICFLENLIEKIVLDDVPIVDPPTLNGLQESIKILVKNQIKITSCLNEILSGQGDAIQMQSLDKTKGN